MLYFLAMVMLPTLETLNPAEAASAGGKASRLASLAQAGFPVPAGFCVPASHFDSWRDPGDGLPGGLAEAVVAACLALATDDNARWAVRTSALGEDGHATSYAGQGESFLDVPTAQVPARVRQCWLTLTTPRAQADRRRWGG
ncbi:MAG: PEP/pyruvate-binding domain-containing protein, partial [Chloroflexota bacterium]